MSRQTIGENPLDALLMQVEVAEVKPEEKDKPEKSPNNWSERPNNRNNSVKEKVAEKPNALNKQRLTVQISEEIIERAKNAVYWTRGLTLAQLVEEALEKAISSLEKSGVIYDDKTGNPIKNKGDAYPQRREELKPGRPVN